MLNTAKNNMDFKNIGKIFEVANKYKPSGEVFPTGFRQFDTAMDKGLREGELVVVSAPTSMGKTSFCQNLTVNFDKIGVPSMWFTYEMNPWYLKEKFLQMGATKEMLGYTPIKYFQRNTFKTEMDFIKYHTKEAIEDYACKVVFIDHLHYLIPLEESKNSSLMIGGVVRELKKMAIEMGVIVFLIAHSKKIYQGEELDLSSIRDSSLISQEADYVFLLERIKEKKDKEFETIKDIFTKKTRIILAKNRRTGNCFSLECMYDNNKFTPYEDFRDISESERIQGEQDTSGEEILSRDVERIFGNGEEGMGLEQRRED
jgi:replicative DNA helicase